MRDQAPPTAVHSLLRASRVLITHPYAWTSGTAARRWTGTPTTPLDPNATAWCVMGALSATYMKHTDGDTYVDAVERLTRLAEALGYQSVLEANDLGGHAVALQLLDQAIAQVSS